jgi:translation elongation factor P/translation initiation factor 5A
MSLVRVLVLSLVATLGLVIAPRARAAVEIGDSVTESATVESIDLSTRTVVLKGADGKTASVVVPESIANLEKLSVGDTVTTTYAVAIAAQIMKPGDEPAPAAVSAAKQGNGQIVGANQVSALLKVNAVDLAKNTVTLTGPKGNTETVEVKRPELQEKLKTLKPGDEVQITYTEAIAIKVEPKAK